MQKLYSCRFCKGEPGNKSCGVCYGYGGKRMKAPKQPRNGKVIFMPLPKNHEFKSNHRLTKKR